MKLPRFRVRTLMVLVLVMGGGLGWTAHRARVQREAVAPIRSAAQTGIAYDWQLSWGPQMPNGRHSYSDEGDSAWRRSLAKWLGPEYVGDVTMVELIFNNPSNSDEVMPSLGQLRH